MRLRAGARPFWCSGTGKGLRKDGSNNSVIQAKLRQFDTHPVHANHPTGLVGWDKDGGWDFEGQLMLI